LTWDARPAWFCPLLGGSETIGHGAERWPGFFRVLRKSRSNHLLPVVTYVSTRHLGTHWRATCGCHFGILAENKPVAIAAAVFVANRRHSRDPWVPFCKHDVPVVTKSMGAFVETGQALARIRDGRTYRDTHETFEAFCKETWEFSRIQAHRLIASSDVMGHLLPMGNIVPINEAQARPLTKLRTEDEEGKTVIDLEEENCTNHSGESADHSRWFEMIRSVFSNDPYSSRPILPENHRTRRCLLWAWLSV